MTSVQITRLGFALGARVSNIDLRKPPDADLLAKLRQAWLHNLLLLFPAQSLSEMEFINFARQFGELEVPSADHQDSNLPSLAYVTNQPHGGKPWSGRKGGVTWHSDENHTTRPTSASLLLAKQVPSVGGDTMFANQYMAYETLSPKLQAFLDELEVWQSIPPKAGVQKETDAVHPVARMHPETKRRALYLGSRAKCFIGMSEEESRPLIEYLNQHATSHEFTYRHRWSVNDLVMWDNRALLHIALRDYDEQREARHLWRTAVVGEYSGRPWAGGDQARPAIAAP